MSAMKRWLETHLSEITDEELIKAGYSQDEIDFMRECFDPRKRSSR